jgi:DNA-binding CsgD family transcriptional regulator
MKESKLENIDEILKTLKLLPGIVYFKGLDCAYQVGSESLAQKFCYNDGQCLAGKSDFDFEGDHKENAATFRAQDELVLKGQEIKQVYMQRYPSDNEKSVYFNSKKPFYINDNIIGIFGNSFEFDAQCIKELASAGVIDTLHLNDNTEQNVYTIAQSFHPNLSPRESLCLYYLMRGGTAKEIGTRMNISPKTVESYIARMREKFDCINKSQLIEKSYAMKFNLYIPEMLVSKIA